jgi:hypothetical protein
MPEKRTIERARKAKGQGKAPTTQAGEFVREEMEHAKRGKHSSGNPKQAIAIGLSKARRAGVKVGPPKKSKSAASAKKSSKRASSAASHRKSAGKTRSSRSSSKSRKSTSRGSASRKSSSRKTASRSRSR